MYSVRVRNLVPHTLGVNGALVQRIVKVEEDIVRQFMSFSVQPMISVSTPPMSMKIVTCTRVATKQLNKKKMVAILIITIYGIVSSLCTSPHQSTESSYIIGRR